MLHPADQERNEKKQQEINMIKKPTIKYSCPNVINLMNSGNKGDWVQLTSKRHTISGGN